MKKLMIHVPKILDLHHEMLKPFEKNYEIIITKNDDDLNHLYDVEIFMGLNLSKEQIENAPDLKWIQSQSSGVNQFPLDIIEKRQIKLTSAKGIHASHMAEYTIMGMMYFSRNMNEMIKNQTNHHWNQRIPQDEILGATVGILALGEIGKALATKCKALGMKVIANSRSMVPYKDVDQMVTIDEVFSQSDYVVSILPYTDDNIALINKKYFDMMKPTAVFINIGRGITVNESDMIEVLKNKAIKGAVLDVFEVEPLPANSPLWDLDNVLITPHLSGLSVKYQQKYMDKVVSNLSKYINNQVLEGEVDFKKGY